MSAALPIKQVIETPRSDRSKTNTVLVLNIDSFKDFKKEFAKANIADSYLKNTNNLSFMKHANAYAARRIALYQLALAEYIRANKDTLDEIQVKIKNMVLRNAIVWSNTSPQDAPNAVKQLGNDPDNIAANFKFYISGFSSDVQDILKKLSKAL